MSLPTLRSATHEQRSLFQHAVGHAVGAAIQVFSATERSPGVSTELEAQHDVLNESPIPLDERLFVASVDALETVSVFIGLELGFYSTLARHGALTSGEIAQLSGTDERCVREWCEQQVVSGILTTEFETRDLVESTYRFVLPAHHAAMLVNPESEHGLGNIGGFVSAITSLLVQTPAVVEAFRSGQGVPFSSYGRSVVEGMDAIAEAENTEEIVNEWIPTMPDVQQRFEQQPVIRVADIGCGGGAAVIALARQFPNVHADGFDLDQLSIDLANRNASRAGVADRVRFHCQDAVDLDVDGGYDLVMSLGCVHDLSQPVPVLAAMRRMAGSTGAVFLQDPLVDPFDGQPGPIEDRFAYCASILHCLPASMSLQPSVATGAAMQPNTLRDYAMEAGFSAVEILPIEKTGFMGFYRLIP
jgi:2-polyprenyl-3-methyl-5-hydroxy-6-metoxy-1,4-benzoquinol methylase